MSFTLNGVRYTLSAEDVAHRLRDVSPEGVRQLAVRIGDTLYPVKQAFEAATGVPRSEFTSHVARRHLASLGFDVVGVTDRRAPSTLQQDRTPIEKRPSIAAPRRAAPQRTRSDESWQTEAEVQAAVVTHLAATGWRILSVADTLSRQRGIDVVAAHSEGAGVGVEVKGYPSRSHADPARAHETKPTQPSTQAGHWYAEAVLAAMRLRSRRPELRSVIALPTLSRYRDLYSETKGSLDAAGIEIWWVSEQGDVNAL